MNIPMYNISDINSIFYLYLAKKTSKQSNSRRFGLGTVVQDLIICFDFSLNLLFAEISFITFRLQFLRAHKLENINFRPTV